MSLKVSYVRSGEEALVSSFAAVVRFRHATVSLQRGREGVAWRDKTMASKETTVCAKPMQLWDNKPLCVFTSDKLEVFSLSPSLSLSLSPMIYHALLEIYKWCIVKAAVWLVTLIAIYLTCRFHVALLLFSYVSQMTSWCGVNNKVALKARIPSPDILNVFPFHTTNEWINSFLQNKI